MSYPAVAVVRVDAIRRNLERVRAAAAGCRLMAVIKANGYGHGLVNVARILGDVDALGVARVSEGVRLREAGITTPVVLLEGCSSGDEVRAAIAHDLQIVVHDPAHFSLLAAAEGKGLLRAWLKIDTGMGRLGFRPDELKTCLQRLATLSVLQKGVVVMTHLACSDDADSPVTMEQMRRFGSALGNFQGDVSVANSAGVLMWPQTMESSLDLNYLGDNWVRPGLALYGASPVRGKSARELGLLPAMSFESRLIAVKTVKRGSRVGYSGAWRARRDTVVGVASVGYGDGYPRHLVSGTPVLVNGRRVSLIGNVSMDMINLDLTDVPVAQVGDPVVLWGGHLPIEEIAARAGTIPYELMCGLSDRVAHQYIDEQAEALM
ncbi:MAG: alanine racemase [Gammaproteobacteria bacterium]|nr:alanine racemase [Gammaproteobacteria bacterium]NND53591.1 alanine racemase [Gammaproteobacteria bacterium]